MVKSLESKQRSSNTHEGEMRSQHQRKCKKQNRPSKDYEVKGGHITRAVENMKQARRCRQIHHRFVEGGEIEEEMVRVDEWKLRRRSLGRRVVGESPTPVNAISHRECSEEQTVCPLATNPLCIWGM